MPLQSQLIGGQTYQIGTPAWQAAMEADRIHQGAVGGQTAGAALTALQQAAGLPLLNSSSSSGSASSASSTVPRVGGTAGGSSTSSGGVETPGWPGSAPGGSPGGSYPTVPQIRPVDNTAANAARFAQAKDQAGQTARGSLTALRDELGGRGMLGGGVEAGATSGLIERAAQGANDMTRQNAITDANQNEENALATYQGGITQRGQDQSYGATLRGQDLSAQQNRDANALQYRAQDITQRGQDISQAQGQAAQQQQSLQGLLSVLNGVTRLY